MRNNQVKILVLCALAIVINVILGQTVSMLKIPFLFLDTMGTIFISATFGMKKGILTGFTTNLVMSLFSGILALPFALVNIALAVIISIVAKHSFTYRKAIFAGIVLALVCPMIGTPIRLLLFGGFTGSGTDIVIFSIRATGKEMITATYWGAVMGNLVDKIISCCLVAWLISVSRLKRFVSVV